ncbi:hypothetical protein [Sphingomonas sp.]|uniref:hypothetical protein n=1 Tax=Sphingomonas sp. TaxID=28214 RepID=UPI003B005390
MLLWIGHAYVAFIGYMDAHGAGLAAIAAILGIPFVVWQITQSGRQEKRRVDARRLAALSTLPMTLHGINDWAKAAAHTQTTVYPWAKRQMPGRQPPPYEPPPSPNHLIEAMERMIEAAPKDRVALTLAAIVSEIQVLNSRLSEADEFTGHNISGQQWSIDDNLIRAAAIYSLAESLYDDARNLSDSVPRDFSRMASALNIMDVRDGNHAETHELLGRMEAKANRYRLARRRGYSRLASFIGAKWSAWRAKPPSLGMLPDAEEEKA